MPHLRAVGGRVATIRSVGYGVGVHLIEPDAVSIEFASNAGSDPMVMIADARGQLGSAHRLPTAHDEPVRGFQRTITGVDIHALRCYEKQDLLGPPRTANGRRRFGPTELAAVRFVAPLRRTGMPISTIREYAEMVRAGTGTAEKSLQLLERHRPEVTRNLDGQKQYRAEPNGTARVRGQRTRCTARLTEPGSDDHAERGASYLKAASRAFSPTFGSRRP
jgi:DNA-binding transcriptional MerR regulator